MILDAHQKMHDVILIKHYFKYLKSKETNNGINKCNFILIYMFHVKREEINCCRNGFIAMNNTARTQHVLFGGSSNLG